MDIALKDRADCCCVSCDNAFAAFVTLYEGIFLRLGVVPQMQLCDVGSTLLGTHKQARRDKSSELRCEVSPITESLRCPPAFTPTTPIEEFWRALGAGPMWPP